MAAPAAVAPPSTGFGFALTEDQEAVRAMVRDFARIGDRSPRDGVGRGADLPARRHGEARRARDARRPRPRGVRRGGPLVRGLHPRRRRALARGRLDRSLGRRAQQPLHESHLSLRKRRPEEEVGDAARAGQAHRRLGADRGRGGKRQRRDEDDGRAGRRRLGPERVEELHHARLRRRRRGPHGRDGPDRGQARDLRVRRGPPPEGDPRGQEGEQARDARLRHGDARDGGLPHPRGEPARRARGGLRPGHEGPRRRAHLDRGAGARDRRGRVRRARAPTPSSGSSSARRSPSSRRSRTISPTWRPRSTRRAS